jgi:hypothetical protein
MNRLTTTAPVAVLLSTMLVGGMLVSVALAATGSEDVKRLAESAAKNVSDANAGPIFDVAADAASATLGISTEQLESRLGDGASMKQIADDREVGYGSVARAANDAVAAALDAAVRGGTLSRERADELALDVAAWIDRGGQPDVGWFGAPA